MPTPRHGLAAVAWKGALFAIAGFVNAAGMGVYGFANESFDPTTNSWRQRYQFNGYGLGAASVGDRIYVFGADATPDGWGDYSTNIYDPVSDTSSYGSSMLTARVGYGTAEINGRIFLVGGCVKTPPGTCGSTLVEEYNTYTNQWSHRASLPQGNDDGVYSSVTAAAYNGFVYAFFDNLTFRYEPPKVLYVHQKT
jgi:hypothetical protein